MLIAERFEQLLEKLAAYPIEHQVKTLARVGFLLAQVIDLDSAAVGGRTNINELVRQIAD